jgi:hypothetical protein
MGTAHHEILNIEGFFRVVRILPHSLVVEDVCRPAVPFS